MHVAKLSFNGNPNVGLYGYCMDGHCILGERLTENTDKEVQEALQVKILHLTIAGTPMPGVFLVGNKNALLVPGIAFDNEVKALKKLKLPVKVFDTHLTCLGNNIIANDHGCLVNTEFSDKEITQLSKLLKVPVKRVQIAGLDTPGSCVVLNGKYGVIHRDAEPHEIAMVKDTLKLESVEPASVSLGSPYIKAGVLNNKHGFVVSETSGGPEIVHLEQSLGYLDG
ncbi:translation initiation factor IF-6 [Candidatus Woesearchaeota archaeon]|nr:translation initiation factor IF-6 [Candidatus Woesearchaeota archaeon]